MTNYNRGGRAGLIYELTIVLAIKFTRPWFR